MDKKDLKKISRYDSAIFIDCQNINDFKSKDHADVFTIRGGFHPHITIIRGVKFIDEQGYVYDNCLQVINDQKVDFFDKLIKYCKYKQIDSVYYLPKNQKDLCLVDVNNANTIKKINITQKESNKSPLEPATLNYDKADYVGHISYICLGAALGSNNEFRERMK